MRNKFKKVQVQLFIHLLSNKRKCQKVILIKN